MYSDLRQKHIIVPGLRPGDTLEYQTVLDLHTPLAPGNFWTQYDFYKRFIVLDEQFEVNVPRTRELKVKTVPGVDAKITDQGDRRIYLWKSSHLVRDDDDSSTTGNKKKKKLKKPEDDRPAIQVSTFTTWQEVGRWYADLERPRRAPNAAIEAKARALTAGSKTDMDKVEALYDYVAKDFRYISLSFGLGRYQPHSASDVLSNEYGDCKDKHTLLASLLTAAGFQTNSVLINSSRKLDPDIPSPSQFDHVITQVKVGKDLVWLDTTTEIAPFRMLLEPLRNKMALVIPQDGTPDLEKTPMETPFENAETDDIDGSINEFGKLTGSIHVTARGDSEVLLRSVFRRVAKPRWKEIANYMLVAGGISGEVSDIQVSEVTATHDPLTMTVKFSAPNFVDWSRKNETFSFPMSSTNVQAPDEDSDDTKTEPLDITGPMAWHQHVRITVPKQFTVRLPLPIQVKREYGQLTSSYKMDGQTIVADRDLSLNTREIARDKLRDYASFVRNVKADFEQKVSLENLNASSTKSGPSMPEGAKADDLFDSAEAAARARRYDLAIPLYKKVVELEPKHKYAWNNLGMAQIDVRRYNDAIASLQRAIANDPYDEWAYNNLGRAYWGQHKYDEAIKAFQKQIEVNPLDKWAHSNLGRLYVERKSYKEAVPELEKALSITPEASALYIAMGQAQLGLGEDDKAMASFDHAVELQPSPLTWNNVAYELAKHKVHLDRARRYAESAVSSVSAVLRNSGDANDDSNRMRQEGIVGSLASYWDTLGWIYFQEGNIDAAEKYISPAWTLTQRGEVADHVGQIWERRGDKAKAAAAYAAALTALPPYEESREALNRLVPDKKKSKELIDAARQRSMDVRTFRLSKKLKQNVSADFDITFVAGAKDPQVSFVSGDDHAKDFLSDLRSTNFSFAFPDETPTRVVRHGVLSCSNYSGDCMFVLVPVTGLPSASAAMLLSSANDQSEQTAQGSAK
jgi:tetratricopeptide (TPR) repeat protein